ncbi:MAG TPA: hypothetical protein VEB67_02155 [Nitrososphaerales archaeon]|nr:hypothetical protein [Nitrososphaerales archaeon]
MGRKGALFAFWILGYFFGAVAWMVKGPLFSAIESIGLSSDLAGGLLAGLFGSSVMVLSLLFWSYLSSSS